MRDLTRYWIKTAQARTSEIQRRAQALESAGSKLGSVASDITGVSATAMIESLIDGERRGAVLADLAKGRMRTAGSAHAPTGDPVVVSGENLGRGRPPRAQPATDLENQLFEPVTKA